MLTPQVQAISSAKRDSLSVAQQEAIKSVIERDPDEQDPWGPDDDDGDSSGSFAFHSFMTLRVYYINLSRYIGSCGRRFRRKLSIKLSVFNKIVTYQKMFSGGLTLLTSSNNHDEDDGNEKIII